jgi:hypothetical protein
VKKDKLGNIVEERYNEQTGERIIIKKNKDGTITEERINSRTGERTTV